MDEETRGEDAEREHPFELADEVLERLRARPVVRDRFEAGGEIARGGMGAVLRVWDRDLERHLAVKIIRTARSERDEGAAGDATREEAERRGVARFLEEAQITGRLDHPGVVPVHDLGIDAEGRIWFSMKLVRGRTLARALADLREGRGAWTQARALGALQRVCEAVAYAHSKGVVHRDLKPENVMVGEFGEVYVMDWGLAKALGSPSADAGLPRAGRAREARRPRMRGMRGVRDGGDARTPFRSPPLTRPRTVLGTPPYLSPEQARGDVEAVDERSDVYAVGAMLYELLAGQMPYVPRDQRVDTEVLLGVIQQRPPVPLGELAPRVAPELVSVCEKAMARDPDARYPSLVELSDDLRAFLETRVVRAHRTGPWREFAKWVQRNRATAAALGLALAVGLAGIGTLNVVQAQWNDELRGTNDELRAARARAEEQERAARRGFALAEQRLATVLRLADAERVRELVAEARGHSAAYPELVDEMEAWRERALELVGRLPAHRADLERARGAAPAVPAEPGLSAEEAAWYVAGLAELVEELEALTASERSPLRAAEQYVELAKGLRGWSVEDRADLWQRACASIADPDECPAYGGLRLEPQVGLVPIGRDPRSGLWEFAHLLSGDFAARDGHGELRVTGDTGIVLVLIPGGTFRMGARRPSGEHPLGTPNTDPDAARYEGPVHAVRLDPFFLSKYETTQEQWYRITDGERPSRFGPEYGDRALRNAITGLHPVESVTWSECEHWLHVVGLELPTEAQWEHAARGGTTTSRWTGDSLASVAGAVNCADRTAYEANLEAGLPWGSLYALGQNDEAYVHEDGYVLHAPVDGFRPNPFGLHHVLGNVMEWCRDRELHYDEAAPRAGDGLREGPGPDDRVVRGGSYTESLAELRSAEREGWPRDNVSPNVGLRAARAIDPTPRPR